MLRINRIRERRRKKNRLKFFFFLILVIGLVTYIFLGKKDKLADSTKMVTPLTISTPSPKPTTTTKPKTQGHLDTVVQNSLEGKKGLTR